MRLLHFLPLFAASGAFAINFDFVVRRDAASEGHALAKRTSSFAKLMITDLNNLTTLTDAITVKIKNLTDANGLVPLLNANTDLIDALTKSTNDVKASTDNLTAADAQALGPPTQFLAYAANASIAALISKKATFDKLGVGTTPIQSLQQQISASNNFSSLLLARIPPALAPVSAALNGQVVDSLNEGLACFQGKNASCITAVVNASRTITAAQDSGAIPKSAAGRTAEISGLLGLGAAVLAGLLFAA